MNDLLDFDRELDEERVRTETLSGRRVRSFTAACQRARSFATLGGMPHGRGGFHVSLQTLRLLAGERG